jgi:N-acetylmuramoyl-L-alanine amidase
MARFSIERNYISYGNARPGIKVSKRRFIVSHDTGNPGSTAIGNRNFFQRNQPKSSAHTFIDDKRIIEIIPLDEVAYHVRYSVPTDNEIYGYDANSNAIGVELCYGEILIFGMLIQDSLGIMHICVNRTG